jgi:hypothetical protein
LPLLRAKISQNSQKSNTMLAMLEKKQLLCLFEGEKTSLDPC